MANPFEVEDEDTEVEESTEQEAEAEYSLQLRYLRPVLERRPILLTLLRISPYTAH